MIGWFFSIILMILVMFIYGYVIYWVDRYEKEPFWLLAISFLWGGVVAIIGAVIVSLVAGVVFLGSANLESPYMAVFIAPPVEEFMKGSWLILLYLAFKVWGSEFDGPVDGLVYGGIVGLGFAITEDFLYITSAAIKGGDVGAVSISILRLLSGFAHPFYTSMTGLGFGLAAIVKKWYLKIFFPIAGFIMAMLFHSIHNGLAVKESVEGVSMAIGSDWLFFSAWFILLILFVIYERSVIIKHLKNETSEDEIKFLSQIIIRNFSNFNLFLSRGYSTYKNQKKRQRALYELAFLKNKLEVCSEKEKNEIMFDINQYKSTIKNIPWQK